MLKRRRGAVLKCAGLIAAFWLGFAFYTGTVARTRDNVARSKHTVGLSTPHATQAEGGRPHMPMPLPLTAHPLEDDKARRDRDLQERFRRDQTKLRELLDGRRTAPAVAVPPDVSQYDPHTASLIRLGLIIPKWNITREVAEHYGAPGKVNLGAIAKLPHMILRLAQPLCLTSSLTLTISLSLNLTLTLRLSLSLSLDCYFKLPGGELLL